MLDALQRLHLERRIATVFFLAAAVIYVAIGVLRGENVSDTRRSESRVESREASP